MNQSITPIRLIDTKDLQSSGQPHGSNAPDLDKIQKSGSCFICPRIDLQEINEELIRYLARHPHLMRTIDLGCLKTPFLG